MSTTESARSTAPRRPTSDVVSYTSCQIDSTASGVAAHHERRDGAGDGVVHELAAAPVADALHALVGVHDARR